MLRDVALATLIGAGLSWALLVWSHCAGVC